MPECKLEYLFSFSFGLKLPPEVIGPVPEGIRANFYLTGGSVEGPRLKGKVLPVGADYLLLRKDGVAVLDVRATFESEDGALNAPYIWGIHLTQVAPRRCGLVDPWTPAHCTQNAPWGARRRSAGNWATRLRFGPIKDYARAMAIAGLETWCYRQAFPGAANGQPQYVVVT